MSVEWLATQLGAHGLTVSDKQKQQFEKYYEMLVEWNEKINLTSITEEHEVYLKHFYDSVTPVSYTHLTLPTTPHV